MECEACDDSGYIWATLDACPRCIVGGLIQYQYDIVEVKRLQERVLDLQQRIEEYERDHS